MSFCSIHGSAENQLNEVSDWFEKNLGEQMIKEIKEHTKIKDKALAAIEKIVEGDPIASLFKDIIMKHQDEIREKIMKLVENGVKSPAAFYEIVREILLRESRITGVLLIPIKGVEESLSSSRSCDLCTTCVSCAVCTSCAVCIVTGIAASMAAVFTGTVATSASVSG